MNRDQISSFEKIQIQLESLHDELSQLSKKSSNDALNKFKLKFVNKTIVQANEILGKNYIPYDDFELFDEETLPTNSDVTMILGQYLNCMEKLRADNITSEFGTWYWVVDKKATEIKTAPPKKIDRK